jgi:UDP-2,3-diacylglucosamine pyrophosphatase LpxH
MSRKLFFSDCHISAGLGLKADADNRYPWEWLRDDTQDRLLAFLKWIGLRKTDNAVPNFGKIDEIIMLGDMFDNWVFPHNIKPPTFSELMHTSNASRFIDEINTISQSIPITYIPGNHDMTVTQNILNSFLPKVSLGTLTYRNSSDSLWAEHGHSWGLFNAPDPKRRDNLPLGYFVSRIVATSDRDKGGHTPTLKQIFMELDDMIKKDEKIPEIVFDAVCEKAGVNKNDVIKMPDDLWNGEIIKIKDIRNTYKNLMKEFKKRTGIVKTTLAVPSEMNNLSIAATNLFFKGVKVVIMGHTHGPAKENNPPSPLAYLNSGCWCSRAQKAAWIEVEENIPGHSNLMKIDSFKFSGLDSSGQITGISRRFDTLVLQH